MVLPTFGIYNLWKEFFLNLAYTGEFCIKAHGAFFLNTNTNFVVVADKKISNTNLVGDF